MLYKLKYTDTDNYLKTAKIASLAYGFHVTIHKFQINVNLTCTPFPSLCQSCRLQQEYTDLVQLS